MHKSIRPNFDIQKHSQLQVESTLRQIMKDEAMPEERDSQETTDISQFFSESYTVSKRQLGIVLLLVGVVGFVGILAIDLVDFGREGGIGPAQQAALAILAMVAIVGVLLIPLGDKPA